jgi:hypothetical protein
MERVRSVKRVFGGIEPRWWICTDGQSWWRGTASEIDVERREVNGGYVDRGMRRRVDISFYNWDRREWREGVEIEMMAEGEIVWVVQLIDGRRFEIEVGNDIGDDKCRGRKQNERLEGHSG